MILIAGRGLRLALPRHDGIRFYDAGRLEGAWGEIRLALEAGEDMFFAATEGLAFLESLWIEVGEPVYASAGRVVAPVAGFPEPALGPFCGRRLCVRPQDRHAMHGVTQAPRAEVLPLAVALDAFGEETAACALLLRHDLSSLSGGHFKGGRWYVFALEDPLAALSADGWDAMIRAALCAGTRAYIAALQPEHALHWPGEPVRIDYRIENLTDRIEAVELDITLAGADGGAEVTQTLELMLNLRDDLCGHAVFYPELAPGMWTVRAALYAQNRFVYGEAREAHRRLIDERAEGFVVPGAPGGVRVAVESGEISVDGARGFWVGTHYYPSDTFFEFSYRPLRVRKAEAAIGAMRRSGVKLCRLWCDPWLDETSLRGLRALVEMLARAGIGSILTLFSSWTRRMGVNTRKRQASFPSADMRDDAFIGLAMKHMGGQRLYVQELAERFAGVDSVIFDFSNEFSVVDPAPDQLDDWNDAGALSLPPPERSIALFRQWAREIEKALRAGGARQSVIWGVSCWDTGSENYRCTRDGDIIATHLYMGDEDVKYHALFQSAACIGKPSIVEEFGGLWPDEEERAQAYALRYRYFLLAGMGAALNYEWGVSWLSDRLSGIPPYMKYNSDIPEDALVGFHYDGRRLYGKSWPDGANGICPWMASFEYGVCAPLTHDQTPTTREMKRAAWLGARVSPRFGVEATYLVLPFETEPYAPGLGYRRKTGLICRRLDELWAMGARFEVWQEDGLASLPQAARVVIYPSEGGAPPRVDAVLRALAGWGVRVVRGAEPLAGAPIQCAAARCEAPAGLVMTRATRDGRMTLALPKKQGEAVDFGGGCRADAGRWALIIEERFEVVAAEFAGALALRGQAFARSDMPVILRAQGPLADAVQIEVDARGAGTIALSGLTRVRVLADDGRTLRAFDANGMIEVTRDMANHRLIAIREGAG